MSRLLEETKVGFSFLEALYGQFEIIKCNESNYGFEIVYSKSSLLVIIKLESRDLEFSVEIVEHNGSELEIRKHLIDILHEFDIRVGVSDIVSCEHMKEIMTINRNAKYLRQFCGKILESGFNISREI